MQKVNMMPLANAEGSEKGYEIYPGKLLLASGADP